MIRKGARPVRWEEALPEKNPAAACRQKIKLQGNKGEKCQEEGIEEHIRFGALF